MCIKYDTYAELQTRHSMCIVCYPHTQNYMSVILRMYIEDDTYAELPDYGHNLWIQCMLIQCWIGICEAEPTLTQHRIYMARV